jgi:hypothetical protein
VSCLSAHTPCLVPLGAFDATRSSRRWQTQPGNWDRLNLRVTFRSDNEWGIPELQRDEGPLPTMLAAYHDPGAEARAAAAGGCIHFFVDDYRFESVWNSPERSLLRMAQVGLALSPDFSLWTFMPKAVQIWQVYRSRWIGAYWQSCGLRVIPTVSWSTPESFDWCFLGVPRGGPVALSCLGVDDDLALQRFREGAREMLARCEPSALVLYGSKTKVLLEGLALPPCTEHVARWERIRGKANGR